MAATRSQIKTQYERAKRLGWVPHFQDAAKAITKGFFDTADLMAIGSRETNLDPKWLTKKGDNGHGAGLMQIDDRSFPEFTNSDKWKDARLGIIRGAEVLMQKWADLQNNVGKTLKVKNYTFKGPAASGIIAQQITIAAYNSGRWAAYHFTKHRHPDYGTTGKDYSADVMARAKVFRELLAKDFPSSAASSQNPSVKEGTTQSAQLPTSATSPPIDSGQSRTENINVENVESVKIDNAPPPQTEPVVVTVERVSIWAKIGAGFAGLSGIGISMGEVLTGKLNGLDPMHFIYVIGGILLMALALYFYDKSQKRAHEKTLEKMKSAADPASNTVELSRK
jgi:hypothetical protein